MTLSPDLQAELAACLLLLTEQAPACLSEILTCRKALDAGSPVLHLRFSRLLENALDNRPGFSDADRRRLGLLAHALNAAAGGEVVDDPMDRSDTLPPVRCSIALKERLRNHCEAQGIDLSTALRAAVREYLEREG